MDFGMLPPGIDLPRGEKALDQITKTLAEIPAGQLQDVMAGMKVSPDTSFFTTILDCHGKSDLCASYKSLEHHPPSEPKSRSQLLG
jgi:hypothetical protein